MSDDNQQALSNDNDEHDQPMNFINKHALEYTWTLWFYEPNRNNSWEENLKEIASFSTVEDFWCLFNHIHLVSELRQGCDYALFKQGIKPMWEDESNSNGGRWVINQDKRYRKTFLDKNWLDTVVFMIGCESDNPGDICGAVVNLRNRGDKISLWTTDASQSQAVKEIGRKFKARLNYAPDRIIEYQVHKDTMAREHGATICSKYRV